MLNRMSWIWNWISFDWCENFQKVVFLWTGLLDTLDWIKWKYHKHKNFWVDKCSIHRRHFAMSLKIVSGFEEIWILRILQWIFSNHYYSQIAYRMIHSWYTLCYSLEKNEKQRHLPMEIMSTQTTAFKHLKNDDLPGYA
jgi:hypothetical protein